jgi:hypothetical protein
MAKTDAAGNTAEHVDGAGADVVVRGPKYDADRLAAVESFDDAVALAAETVGEIANAADELGDGFAILSDKNKLVGVPCMFLSWNFNLGDYGEFVSAQVVARTESGGVLKVIVNDGGAGIYQQLSDFTAKSNKLGGLFARHGLRRSDYTYKDEKGKDTPATTYYIDQTA